MELLKNSVAMQEQVLACKGFLVSGYALEKVRQTQIGSAGKEIQKYETGEGRIRHSQGHRFG